MEARQEVTPMQVRETRVYLPNNAGGFDLLGCPNAEELAALIVRACNAHDALIEELRNIANAKWDGITPEDFMDWAKSRARHTLAKVEAA